MGGDQPHVYHVLAGLEGVGVGGVSEWIMGGVPVIVSFAIGSPALFGNVKTDQFKRQLYVAYRRLESRYLKGFRLDEHLKEYHGKLDPKVNTKTSPPTDEFIDLVCIWAVEFYTPAHTDRLIEGLAKLGMGHGSLESTSQDPISWLQGLRVDHRGDAWFNLGILTPSKSNQFFGGIRHEVPLPPNVQYA